MNERLLLVEDDAAVAEVVSLHLGHAGYRVQHVADGLRARDLIDHEDFELLLLDLMLPGADGWALTRHVRQRADHVPIIMLSARAAEAERVLGLELGADDYLAKPFSMLELTARVRALLRRAEQWRALPAERNGLQELHIGALRIAPRQRLVWIDDEAVPLTLREFDLLHFLAEHRGQIFSRSELLARVWGAGFDGYEHTVNSHINRLRAKLEKGGAQPRFIGTVWGLGYRFDADASDRCAGPSHAA